MVSGTHTYTSTGTFTVTTTIKDDGGSMTTATCSVIVFAFANASNGAFVIGDRVPQAIGSIVTWWSSQWWQVNPMSGGPPPASMKGFAGFEDNLGGPLPGSFPECDQPWTTDTGNSTPPPPTVPAIMGVIVSSHVDQVGSDIVGDVIRVVVVRNNPGYQPDPGHVGTGQVVGYYCGPPPPVS
jgi:hypothetical protein